MKFSSEFQVIIWCCFLCVVSVECGERMFYNRYYLGNNNIEMQQKNIINVPSFDKQKCPDGWIFQESRCQEIVNF